MLSEQRGGDLNARELVQVKLINYIKGRCKKWVLQQVEEGR